MRRNCRDLDTAIGRMVSLLIAVARGASWSCSIPGANGSGETVDGLWRLSSAELGWIALDVGHGIERWVVVGTPLMVWMACLVTDASEMSTAPSIKQAHDLRI